MILRQATLAEIPAIWEILQYAIEKRRNEGSKQWQDGYPNPETVRNDINRGYGYVLDENGVILTYASISPDGDPDYENIDGEWLTNDSYMVVHRVAASPLAQGKRTATRLFELLEPFTLERNIHSIKVDTNFDNLAMLKILQSMEYVYCGEVYIRGAARKAFEKVLSPRGE